MALHHIAEALMRVEHKLDAILKAFMIKPQPMEFTADPCPGCGKLIQFQIDPVHSVVVRRCGCKTGKIPPTFSLIPVQNPQRRQQGEGNGQAEGGEDGQDQRREGRRNQSRSHR